MVVGGGGGVEGTETDIRTLNAGVNVVLICTNDWLNCQ